MSVAGLATLGVTRDSAAPTKGDVGKAPPGTPAATAPPSNLDLLASTVPTGIVGIYTAFVAAVAAEVKPLTSGAPNPQTYEALRWGALVFVVVLAAGLIWRQYKAKGGAATPAAEMGAAALATLGWSLSMPESPLVVTMGDDYGPVVPIAIAFVFAGLTLLVTNNGLQNQRT